MADVHLYDEGQDVLVKLPDGTTALAQITKIGASNGDWCMVTARLHSLDVKDRTVYFAAPSYRVA